MIPAIIYQPLVPAAAQLQSGGAPSTAGYIKVWTGATWELKPVKYWNGATWEIKPVKFWNGASWELT